MQVCCHDNATTSLLRYSPPLWWKQYRAITCDLSLSKRRSVSTQERWIDAWIGERKEKKRREKSNNSKTRKITDPHLEPPFSRWISKRQSVGSWRWVGPWQMTVTMTTMRRRLVSHFDTWPGFASQRTTVFRGCAFPCEARRLPAVRVVRWCMNREAITKRGRDVKVNR